MINVDRFVIDNVCLKSFPCQHKCTVFINPRKITSFYLKADEISALYELFEEKVFFGEEGDKLHFQGIPEYAMRSQEQLNILKEKTTEKINKLISEAIWIMLA